MHWKAKFDDDHRVFAYSDGNLWSQITEYRKEHPKAKLTYRSTISKAGYAYHIANKHNPVYWYLMEQGDEMNLTDGQCDMAEKLRNIPPPKTGMEEYLVLRMEFEATKPQSPESWGYSL